MRQLRITQGFWHDRLEVNASKAIFHQWEQLEASGCIENFRIAAGEADGCREGWFFADSDAYKWLEAASRIYAWHPDPKLGGLVDDFVSLLGRAQAPDGYVFTYNQIHFPGTRWVNLQIEHELYCHGHLIEAGVSHYQATGRTELFHIARRAADRIVEDFRDKGPEYTPGHEEIEVALLRLHQAVVGDTDYLELARQFIDQRGRMPLFAFSILKQNASVEARGKFVRQEKQKYLAAHPDFEPFQLPPGNTAQKPPNTTLRWYASVLTGKYFQQHAPARKQWIPTGHAVRFGYLETAIAMLARETGDASLTLLLEHVWEHMVTRRMYVTGGLGSLPGVEGFGKDYELDPEYAYAETCAALASLFWNWEMAQLTGEAKYSDLFEWQLYNAAAVGMGSDGSTYLYNNPLACRGGVTRKPWYAVPCCPSNLSRTWANIGEYVFSQSEERIWVHQYISSQYTGELAQIDLRSGLPWEGKVAIHLTPSAPQSEFTLSLRLPSWSGPAVQIRCNGEGLEIPPAPQQTAPTASGVDPRQSDWISIRRTWSPGDQIEVEFDMPVRLRKAHPSVKGHRGKVAVTRGPLVYCLESIDHPGRDIFAARLDPSTIEENFAPDLLGGTIQIAAKTTDSEPLTFIPYSLWGNRGPSQMTVWVNA